MHLFTDKKGQQITATVLDITDDKRLMKIRREDGQEFQTEIVSLCLEDQQYLRKWLEKKPVVKEADFSLKVSISRKSAEAIPRERGSMDLEAEEVFFDITVSNVSRETLQSAQIRYAFLRMEGIKFIEDDDGDWTYDVPTDEEPPMVKEIRSMPLPDVVFNRDVTVKTEPFYLEQVTYQSTGNLYREDSPVGLYLQVLSPSGKVLLEAQSGKGGIERMSWSDVEALPNPGDVDY